MSAENELLDLMDAYAKGALSEKERASFEQRMASDSLFKENVEDHIKLVKALQLKDDREKLKNKLNQFHTEIEAEPVVSMNVVKASNTGFWKRYWPLTAVAASIALISVLGTLVITQGLETKQTAYYKELRRNVDQIKKSQKLIMQGMAETKEKANTHLTIYAGTGFLISSNGYIATSYHVVKDADSVYIENKSLGTLKASVYYSDATNDVAILKISNDTLRLSKLPYTIQTGESDLGENVYTLGFPREDIVFGEGSVSASTGYQQNVNAYQVSVPVNPGNSGGPLLNNNGDLVGMISGIQTETSGATFAIKSSVILSLIDSIPADTLSKPIVLPSQTLLRRMPKVDQVKKWKELVFMVRVYNN